MGRVRINTVKKSAKLIIEKYYTQLTLDFHVNKRLCDEVAHIPSKRLRNKIAGFVTHLMRRISNGDTIRGISIKLQEEERERKDNYVPAVSEVDTSIIEVDSDTRDMLRTLGYGGLNSVVTQTLGGRQTSYGVGKSYGRK